MCFADNQEMIEAFTTNTAEQPLAHGVRAWCLHPKGTRRSEYLNPGACGNSVEACTLLRIIIANEVRGRLPKRGRFPELVGDPCVRR